MAEYLQRGDRTLEALGESPEAVARRYVDGLSPGLGPAARRAGVPYVRVNKGRLAACVQALARDFGLAAA